MSRRTPEEVCTLSRRTPEKVCLLGFRTLLSAPLADEIIW